MRIKSLGTSPLKASIRVLAVFTAAALLSGCSSSMDRFMSWRSNTSDSDPVYTAALPKKKAFFAPKARASDSEIASAPLSKPSWKLNGKKSANEYASLRKTNRVIDRQPSNDVTDDAGVDVASNDDARQLKASGGKIRIERGMTMYSVASANGLSVKQLARANGIKAPFMIREGQILRMPSGIAKVNVPRNTLANQKQQIENQAVAHNDQQAKPQLPKGGAQLVENGQSESVETVGKPVQQLASNDVGNLGPKVNDIPEIPKPDQNIQIGNGEEVETAPVTVDVSNGTGINGLRWPVKGKVIAEFGKKPDGAKNEGINIAVPEGTMIKAAGDGVVAYAGNELKGYGNLVLIRHEGGFVTAYAHAKELNVKKGDAVKRGDVIGKAGQTGAVNSPQLHFEVRKGPTALDPLKYLGNATALN
jgi:murein DD-endopeptidase MepM/ murein hydrolase activator NlpD